MWSAFTVLPFLFINLFPVRLAQNPETGIPIKKRYPPFWNQVSGNISEFPVQDNKIIINIWNYVDRLRMYKILITQTNKYFVQFGKNNTGNVLWTLTLIYGKLYKTDRFSDPSNKSVCASDTVPPGCISANSGWGGVNFFVIVMNFLAAVESKFLNVSSEIVLESRGENKTSFCYSVKECRASYPHAMDTAKEFYQYLQSRRPDSTLSNISVYNTSEEKATLLMWKTHRAAVNIGLSKFSARSWYSSEFERNFTMNFLTSMEFYESTICYSHFNSSRSFLVGFPHRLLKDGETTLSIDDFTIREKAFISLSKFISDLNDITGGWFLIYWKLTVESSELHRSFGRFLVNTLLLIPSLQ